ncbi:hypothetical protein FJZ36_15580 [Candidatus Poribacteria bacterium]|nr:hypothetical protein [Candidatus Poribacteria bacterium]
MLHFSDTDEVSEHSLDDVRGIYEAMSEQGFLFVIATADGTPVGEVCLQWMNIERAGVKPGEKVMRFPIVICDPRYWGTAYPKRREQVTH